MLRQSYIYLHDKLLYNDLDSKSPRFRLMQTRVDSATQQTAAGSRDQSGDDKVRIGFYWLFTAGAVLRRDQLIQGDVCTDKVLTSKV